MTIIKKLNNLKYGLSAGLMATLLTATNDANATGLAEVTGELQDNLANVPNLFTSAAYIMGVGFTIAGLFKLKEYVDDPTSGNMKNALIRLGIGALLILLPFTINASSDTLGGAAGGAVTYSDVGALN